jgi:8-oxo-dGTP pyrophosphatase MutT (NUDIX family)
MIEQSILAAIRARLTEALHRPLENYRPLRINNRIVGWLNDARAARVALFDEVFDVRDDGITFVAAIRTPDARTDALERVTVALAGEGLLSAWRDERYAVSDGFGTRPLFLLERAAARFFGITTYAAHVNGLVQRNDAEDGGIVMWLARRSPTKAIDPGLRDNLVGGGIAAGVTVSATVIKEASEEAGIAAPLARRAMSAGAVHICRAQPDGLQRETIFVHDLVVPREFLPASQDGEAVEHRLISVTEAAQLIANTDGPEVVTADASLVIVDYLLRHGMIPADAPDYLALEALRHPQIELRQRR